MLLIFNKIQKPIELLVSFGNKRKMQYSQNFKYFIKTVEINTAVLKNALNSSIAKIYLTKFTIIQLCWA